MIRRNHDVSRPNVNQTSSQFATGRTPNLKNKLAHAARVMAPTLVALTFASVAHAQGTMDFSGAQTLMGTFNDRLAYVAISRASADARIYTNDAETLGQRLSTDISKTAALVDPIEVFSRTKSGHASTPVEKNIVIPTKELEIDFEGFALSL